MILEPSYGVALSADKRYPAAGDTVNFKVTVNARHGYAVNARVAHTEGLTLASTPSAPDKTIWENYSATKRQGDFFIGTESVAILGSVPTPTYEITLPFQVQTGATVSDQCVTVTVTGLPEAVPRIFNQAGDDPTDNTATLCLAPLPLFQEDGDSVALWTVYPCVSNTTQNTRSATEYPCDSTDSLVAATVDNATGTILSAAPNQVNTFIKLDPVAAAVVDTHWTNVHAYRDQSNSWHNNSDKVSWQTKRTCPLRDLHGHGELEEDCSSANDHSVPGVRVGWSHVPFKNQYADWGHYGRIISISGVGDGLDSQPAQYAGVCTTPDTAVWPSNLLTLPPAPGGMMVRSSNGQSWWFRLRAPANNDPLSAANYPRWKMPRLNNSNNLINTWRMYFESNTTTMYQRLVEFGELGTYVVDRHESMIRIASTPNVTYCDTLRTVFHVGPVAELGVWDGDANPDLPSNQVAYTLTLANVGPDAALAAQALVELPDDATSVRTIPPDYGTFHAAGTVAGVSHGPYWLWNVGELPTPDSQQLYRRPQGREVTLVVGGASANDTATATVSNGNGHCKVGTTKLPHVIRTEDCAAINADTTNSITTAEWVLDNPYTLCLNYDSTRDDEVIEVSAASETACEGTTANPIAGNSWHAGTVLDHYQGNNVAQLTARAGGSDDSSAGAKTVTTPFTYVTLSWPKATDAAEYRVFRSTTGAAGSYQRIAKIKASGNDNETYQDETVLAEATYYYHVDALYPSQKLAEIHTMSITATREPLKSADAPGTVGNLKAARQQTDATKIDVTWEQPTIDATDATRYDVLYRSRPSGGSWTDWNEAAKEQTAVKYTLEDAGGGTTHQFRVRGVNLVDGDSHPGHWSTATVQPLKNPEQVQGLTAARKYGDETKIDVTWSAPVSSGTPLTHYDVQYQKNGGAWEPATPDRQAVPTDGSTPAYVLKDILGADRYLFRVSTVNVTGGESVIGNPAYSNTVPAVTTPGTVRNLKAERQSDDRDINVTWKPPSNGTGQTTYKVQYKKDNSGWIDETTPVPAADSNDATVTYAFNDSGGGNSSYVFRVQAVTSRGGSDLTGSWSNPVTVRKMTAPNQVGRVVATPNGETSIVVDWAAPSGGTEASGYYLRYSVNGAPYSEDANNWIKIAGKANSDYTLTLTGSDADNGYQFQVRAYAALTGSELLGNWRSSNRLPGLPPGKIAEVRATRNATDAAIIDVAWDESSRVVTYEVQHRTDRSGWSTVKTTTETVRNYSHPKSGGVETHWFRVRGVNANGNGEWTEAAQVDKPDLEYHGADVGVDWVTLKMTSGPWWYEFRKNGDWGGCVQVANGGDVTITGLWPSTRHAANLYDSSGCSGDKMAGGTQSWVTLSDIYDWGKCWNTDDCRDIDNPNDFNNHTHKRSLLGALGVNRPDCAFSREHHSHGWPDGGGGQHWHCPN